VIFRYNKRVAKIICVILIVVGITVHGGL